MSLDLPHTRFSRAVDRLLVVIGRAANWIWLILLFTVVINVALRYLLGEGRVELEELQWHLNSVGFLLAISYAYQADAHIRIDVFAGFLSPRSRAWIELYGILLLMLPFLALVLYFSVPFVTQSYASGEVSQSPGGLPFRWFLKGFLPFAFVLLLLATLARLLRVWVYLARRPA